MNPASVYCLMRRSWILSQEGAQALSEEVQGVFAERSLAEAELRRQLVRDDTTINPIGFAGSLEGASTRSEAQVCEVLVRDHAPLPQAAGTGYDWLSNRWWRDVEDHYRAVGAWDEFGELIALFDRVCPYRIVPVELES